MFRGKAIPRPIHRPTRLSENGTDSIAQQLIIFHNQYMQGMPLSRLSQQIHFFS